MKAFDYFEVGGRLDYGRHCFSEAEVREFDELYGPQPCHFESLPGGSPDTLFVSGWHLGCIWMRKLCEFYEREQARLIAEGRGALGLGPSPGLQKMRWMLPVLPGEEVGLGSVITLKRPLESRPGWGIVCFDSFAEKADSSLAMQAEGAMLVEL